MTPQDRRKVIAMLERCGLVTGPNLLFSEGQRYRSLGVSSNVRESDLFALIDAVTEIERERCANAVDSWMRREDMTGDDIRAG